MDIRVLGLGNVLMGDDALGPYVIEALNASYVLPDTVEAIDLGTPGLDLMPYLLGADVIIVVDTVRADGPGGALRLYRRDAILEHIPRQRLGPHDPGFKQALLAADFAGGGPRDVLLVGVVPDTTAPRACLSPPVRAAVPHAVAAVVAELERLGAAPTLRESPLALEPWWEKTVA